MRIAVCEDNVEEAQRLVTLVERWMAARQMTAQLTVFPSGEALLASWEPGMYPVIFMDIYLDGKDGIAVCKAIRKRDKDCAFVLTTSSVAHGLDGFAVGAVHYLLKPVREAALGEALQRCAALLERNARYLEFSENRVPTRLFLREIRYIEVYRNNSVIHATQRDHTAYATLDSLLEQLESAPFLRCHRSYAVNLHYVEKLADKEFLLKDGACVPVSRAYRLAARQQWDEFIASVIRGGRPVETI